MRFNLNLTINLNLMKNLFSLLLLLSLLGCTKTNAQLQFNGDFEKISTETKFPTGWTGVASLAKFYDYAVDSTIVQHGKYSLSIASKGNGGVFGNVMFYNANRFKGKTIELRGYIKTENVTGGYAGFWLRIDGTSAFNNMADQNIHGTTDWKEYSITLPYDDEKAININAGALLVGRGKMWFDNMQLLIDGKPIEQAEIKKIVLTKAQQDTAFSKKSGIDKIVMNQQQIKNLTMLGQVWGFIKYHHPEVAKGNYNMDAEVFRVMPSVLKATNNSELSAAIEQWVDKFGVPQKCGDCKPFTGSDVTLQPDYGQLFDRSVLSASLTDKLTYILNNRNNTAKNYYVDMVWGVGNPVFNNENPYYGMEYPDAGFRLLCLYRYWNMIKYFYPYRHLIGEDWNKVLPEFIPQFVNDANAQAYMVTAMAMISSIHDTHANIWSANAPLEDYRGRFSPPFKARFIEGKLVVTGYYNDTLSVKDKFKIGDIITAINGVSVTELVKKFLPVTAASNYPTQLRDMPRTYLLRSNRQNFTFTITRDGKTITQDIEGIAHDKINYAIDFNPDPKLPGYYLIDKQIGYLYPAKYHNKDLPEIEKLFKDTKGIIIDMRCYPSEFMPFTFVPFIKTGDADFVKFSQGRVSEPGVFLLSPPLKVNPTDAYKGKVVVLVNEQTQSQAEYTTMAFQSSPNVTVIGSTTAGADGNVSQIVLPGNISTLISGIDVLYPDGTETQRKGVKINMVIKPTIAGVKAGHDELLEKAKQLILNNDRP